jgi:hypothetical protein
MYSILAKDVDNVNLSGYTYVDTDNIRREKMTSNLWRSSPPLTAVGALMLFVAVLSAVGIFIDPRVITGAPAWLKPWKFAISTAVYSLTLAWLF